MQARALSEVPVVHWKRKSVRIPATEVEQVVNDRTFALLADGTAASDAVSVSSVATEQRGELVAQAAIRATRSTSLRRDARSA
jgi:hypothetical protein